MNGSSSVLLALLMILSSLAVGISVLPTSSAQTVNSDLVQGAPIHYGWVGYLGNNTVYLSSGPQGPLVFSSNMTGNGGVDTVTAHTEYHNASSDSSELLNVNVTNSIDMGAGGAITIGGQGNSFPFEEQYIYPNYLTVQVPLIVMTKSTTFNESNRVDGPSLTWQNISAFGVNVSSQISGINQTPTAVSQFENGAYDEAVNSTTSIYSSTVGGGYSRTIIGIAKASVPELDTLLSADVIPGVDFVTIPLTVAEVALGAYDFVQGYNGAQEQTVRSPEWVTNSWGPNPIYHNYTAQNGTFWGSNWSETAGEFQNSIYSDRYNGSTSPSTINYTNVFFSSEMLLYNIPNWYFNRYLNINLKAQDYVSQKIPAYDASSEFLNAFPSTDTPIPGASSTLSIPMVPSNMLWGQAQSIGGFTFQNQNILIKQTDSSNGSVSYFYEKTDQNGNYRFMAHPGWNYSIQAVTPYGLLGVSPTVKPTGNYETELNVIVYKSEFEISFIENGLPTGTEWGVTFDGNKSSSTSQTIYFNETFGQVYSYLDVYSANPYYNLTPNSGNVTPLNYSPTVELNAIPVTESIAFQETGLPSGSGWSVYLEVPSQKISTTSSGIHFTNMPYGPDTFTISPPIDYTSTPNKTTVDLHSSSVVVNTTFSPVPLTQYSITFKESGLNYGAGWAVRFNGTMISSTTATITFYAVNG